VDFNEMKVMIAKRHAHWCNRLEFYFERSMTRKLILPRATLMLGKPQQRLQGQMRMKRNLITGEPEEFICRYSVCHALIDSEYDATIAHEVAHAFQRQLKTGRQKWHGEFFHYLMNDVMGFTGNQRCGTGKHQMKARAMYQVLQPMRKMFDGLDITGYHIQERLQSVAAKLS